jgi:hypothetical protein
LTLKALWEFMLEKLVKDLRGRRSPIPSPSETEPDRRAKW